MTDAFSVLKADHTEVETMLTRLVGGSGPASGSAGDPAGTAQELVMEESRHEAAEEMYFWPAVREKVAGGDRLADEAERQEGQGKRVLDELRKAKPGDGRFDELVTAFASAGRAHIAFEEEQVWPKLRAVLSPQESAELGQELTTAKQAGPTRPHPNAPDSPGALKTAGAAAAMVDKARDAVTGRGN